MKRLVSKMWKTCFGLLLFINVSQTQCSTNPTPTPMTKEENFRSYSLSLGNLTEFARTIQVDEYGKTNSLDWNPYVAFSYHYSLSPSWRISPELGVVLPKSAFDQSMIRWVSFLRVDGGLQKPPLIYRAGLGIFMTHMRGKGGLQTLRNGGTSSTFYNPSLTTTSFNTTLDLGIEFFFVPALSTKLQVHTYSLFRSLSRKISYTLALTFYF